MSKDHLRKAKPHPDAWTSIIICNIQDAEGRQDFSPFGLLHINPSSA
jgi:hypothetical protein